MTEELREKARGDRIAVLRQLVDRLRSIKPTGDDRFETAPASGVFDRVYGGQSLAEALLAAAATTPSDRTVNSAHCYFLRLGDPTLPTTYVVDRLRDTRSFSVRQVRAEQAGRPIITATFSFATANEGITHQGPAPDAPPPEDLASRDVELL